MRDVFGKIQGQSQVVEYLDYALDHGLTTHAYLICGGDADVRHALARAFAAALVAADDQDQVRQVLEGVHPDFRLLSPGGASGYVADQVRELVHDAELAPIRAPRKVYVLEGCERLQGVPANAFLKTLEEPPADVVCILLSATEQAVLETLRSRCEVLTLNEVITSRVENHEAFELMGALAHSCDNRMLLSYASRIAQMAKSSTEELEQQQGRELEQGADYLTAGAKKEIEKRHKREIAAAQRAALSDFIGACRSWLRDCMLCQQDCEDMLSYPHLAAETGGVAAIVTERAVLEAIEATRLAETRISYNVTPQLAIEAMCIEIREALCRQ